MIQKQRQIIQRLKKFKKNCRYGIVAVEKINHYARVKESLNRQCKQNKLTKNTLINNKINTKVNHFKKKNTDTTTFIQIDN